MFILKQSGNNQNVKKVLCSLLGHLFVRNALNLISETVGVDTLFQLQMAALSNPLSELKLNILKQVGVANNKREKKAKGDERRLLIETEYCRQAGLTRYEVLAETVTNSGV